MAARLRVRRFHFADGTPDALRWNMRPLDGTRLTHVVTHLFQDVYYWCGISGWGLAGLFAVFIGAIGTFTNFRMDRLLVRAGVRAIDAGGPRDGAPLISQEAGAADELAARFARARPPAA
jgi:hypothetical protein